MANTLCLPDGKDEIREQIDSTSNLEGTTVQKRRLSAPLSGLVIGCALCFCGGLSLAAEFTAELYVSTPAERINVTLSVKDNLYLLKQLEGDFRILAIVNRLSGITTALNPEEKQYKKLKSPESAFLNPIEAWENFAAQLEGKAAGTEMVGGYTCEKQTYSHPGQTEIVMEVWTSTQLGHFIKQVIKASNGENTLELKNIKEGPLDDSLFAIPAGYTEFVEPAQQTPSPPSSITTAVTVAAPTGRRIAAGGKLKIAVNPAADVTVSMRNDFDDKSVWTLVPFKHGKELSSRAKSFSQAKKWAEEKAEFTSFVDPNSMPDTIVIQVEEGLVSAVVEQTEAAGEVRDYYVRAPAAHGLGMKPGTASSIMITGDSQEGSLAAGKLTVDRTGTKEGRETISFAVGNNETKSWTFTKEVKVGPLKIDQGAVKVHIEQPPVKK